MYVLYKYAQFGIHAFCVIKNEKFPQTFEAFGFQFMLDKYAECGAQTSGHNASMHIHE